MPPQKVQEPKGVTTFDADVEIQQPDNIHAQEPKHRHHWVLKVFKWIFISFISLLGILILTPNILGLIYTDIPPINDGDLLLPVVTIPEGENMYPYLLAATKNVTSPSAEFNDLLTGKKWDSTEATVIISANKNNLAAFADAASKPLYQDPVTARPLLFTPASVVPAMTGWRTIAEINDLQALLLFHTGKPADALKQAEISLSVGHKISNSQGWIVEWLVGLAIETEALTTISTIVDGAKLNPKDLTSLMETLKMNTESSDGLIRALKLEYISLKNQINELASGGSSTDQTQPNTLVSNTEVLDRTNFYFHPHESISYLAEDRRQNIAYVIEPCTSMTEPEIKKRAPSNLMFLLVTPNAIGIVLNDIVSGATFYTSKKKMCDQNLLIATIRVQAAVKAFTLDTGKAPKTLDLLVPKYISEVPLDPYTEKPLGYDPIKNQIESSQTINTVEI
jgi:hypothetical protein